MIKKYTIPAYTGLLISLLISKSLLAQEIPWREFDSMGFDRDNSWLIKAKQAGKQYYYHLKSEVLIDKMENRAAGLTVVVKDGRYGVIRDNGSLIVPFEYDGVGLENKYEGQWYEGIPYDYKFVILRKNSQYGIADEDGRVIVQPQYAAIKVISKHIIGFKEDNQWGWLDVQNGEVLQSPAYEEIDAFLSVNHVRIHQNGRVGLAGKDGSIIIPPEYSGFLRYVYTKSETYIQAVKTEIKAHKDEKVYVLYDSLGNKKLTGLNEGYGTMHHADFVTFEEEGLMGGIDPQTGEIVIDPVYGRIEDGVRGLFLVKKDNLYGVLDEKGNMVVPVIFSDISFINVDNQTKGSSIPMIGGFVGGPSSEDEQQVALRKHREYLDSQAYFIRVVNDQGMGIFDWRGNMVVSPGKYDNVMLKFHKKAFIFAHNKENQKLVILNDNGEQLAELPYELDRSYKYNMSAIENNWELRRRFVPLQQSLSDGSSETHICLYDLENPRIVVPMDNQHIEWLDEGFFKVSQRGGDRKISLYNSDGEHVIIFSEPVSDLFVVGPDRLLLKEDRIYRLVNMNGNSRYENPQWQAGSGFAVRQFPEFKGKNTGVFHHGLMKLYMKEGNMFLNEEGAEVRFDAYTDVDEFYTGTALAALKVPDRTNYQGYSYRYGLIDKEGNEIHPMGWERVSVFSGNPDFIVVTKNEKLGLLDRKGNYILEPVYDHIESSSSYPNFQIKKGEKSGLIATDGSIVVEPRYEQLRRNYRGESSTWPLMVKEGDWYYVIDKAGNPFPIRSKKYDY